MNSQVSPTPDEVIIWQAVAATESTGPQWGTGHPTFPPITHPLPFYPPPHFPPYHPPGRAMSQIKFFCFLLRDLSFFLEQKYAIFRSNCLTLSQLQSYFLTMQLGMKFLVIRYAQHVFCICQLSAKLNPVMFLNKCIFPVLFLLILSFTAYISCVYSDIIFISVGIVVLNSILCSGKVFRSHTEKQTLRRIPLEMR